MALETVKSSVITDRDATPRVLANSRLVKANLLENIGICEVSALASIGSKYIFARIPSNARISELLLHSDDVGATGDADFGIYETTENGGAVVDADHFASALDINAAALAGTNIAHESGVFPIESLEMPLWEALGLTEDPNKEYDIVATLTEAAADGGTLVLKTRYAI